MQHASNVELTYCSLRINHLWNFDSIGLQIQILEIEKMNIAKSIQANPLSQEDLKHIATQINDRLDVIILGEESEQVWIEWAIAQIMPAVPPNLLRLIGDAADGLDDAEIEKYEVALANDVSELITVPFPLKHAVMYTIRPIIRELLKYAKVGNFMTIRASCNSPSA